MLKIATILVALAIAAPASLPASNNSESKTSHQNASANHQHLQGAPTNENNAAQTYRKPATSYSKQDGGWLYGWSLSDKIAAIASFMAFLQFLALIGTIWVMTKSDERQMRAYVNIKGGGINAGEATLTIKNFGQTPAYQVKFWMDAVLTEEVDDPSFERKEDVEISGGTVLAPTAKFITKRKIRDTRKPAENLLTRPPAAYYVFGEISYIDAFKTKRTTTFRYYRPFKHGGGSLTVYDNGNDAD